MIFSLGEGDILGSSISGIENLLRMPYGCGEQNMINFAPSMFIRAYLETVGQLTPSIKEKSLRFMTLGMYYLVWSYGMVLYGVVCCSVVWYGMVWYGMVWYGMVWYGMVWYGMV
jgi:hypothetical protein